MILHAHLDLGRTLCGLVLAPPASTGAISTFDEQKAVDCPTCRRELDAIWADRHRAQPVALRAVQGADLEFLDNLILADRKWFEFTPLAPDFMAQGPDQWTFIAEVAGRAIGFGRLVRQTVGFPVPINVPIYAVAAAARRRGYARQIVDLLESLSIRQDRVMVAGVFVENPRGMAFAQAVFGPELWRGAVHAVRAGGTARTCEVAAFGNARARAAMAPSLTVTQVWLRPAADVAEFRQTFETEFFPWGRATHIPLVPDAHPPHIDDGTPYCEVELPTDLLPALWPWLEAYAARHGWSADRHAADGFGFSHSG